MTNFALTTSVSTEAIAAISIGQHVIQSYDISGYGDPANTGYFVVGTVQIAKGVAEAKLMVQAQTSDNSTSLQVRLLDLNTNALVFEPAMRIEAGYGKLFTRISDSFALQTNHVYQIQARSERGLADDDDFSIIQSLTFV